MMGNSYYPTPANQPAPNAGPSSELLDRQQEAETFLRALYGDEAPGFIAIFTLPDEKTHWVPAQNMRRVARGSIQLSDENNVYFGIGLHAEVPDHGRGEASGVSAIPGFWMDADLLGPAHKAKDLPPTITELLEIINSLPHPPSAIVDSGHGLQVWWLFKEPWTLENEEERKLCQQLVRRLQRWLQRKAREKGYRMDNTSDLARVLRIPGTINRKPNLPAVPVKRLHLDESLRYNPDDFDWLPEVEAEYLTRSEHSGNFPLAQVDPILAGCAWLRHCQEDAETLPEPHWYAMHSILGHCQDGEQLAHTFSKPYPGYTPEETQKKLQQALRRSGPRTCANIHRDLEFEGCQACPNWGLVTSPIILGQPPSPRLIAKREALMIEQPNGTKTIEQERRVFFGDEAEAKGFTMIPNSIISSNVLTPMEKAHYNLLRKYAFLSDECFPGQDRLKDEVPCSRENVSRTLGRLQDLGLITIIRRGQGWPNRYRIEPLTPELIDSLYLK